MINGKIIAALVIHFAVFLALLTENYPVPVYAFIGVFLALNVVGLLMLLAGSVKPGGIVFMVGSVVFIPIGLIGMLGARQAIDEVRRKEFSLKE